MAGGYLLDEVAKPISQVAHPTTLKRYGEIGMAGMIIERLNHGVQRFEGISRPNHPM